MTERQLPPNVTEVNFANRTPSGSDSEIDNCVVIYLPRTALGVLVANKIQNIPLERMGIDHLIEFTNVLAQRSAEASEPSVAILELARLRNDPYLNSLMPLGEAKPGEKQSLRKLDSYQETINLRRYFRKLTKQLVSKPNDQEALQIRSSLPPDVNFGTIITAIDNVLTLHRLHNIIESDERREEDFEDNCILLLAPIFGIVDTPLCPVIDINTLRGPRP